MNCKKSILAFLLSGIVFLITAQTDSIVFEASKVSAALTGIDQREYNIALASYEVTDDNEAVNEEEEDDIEDWVYDDKEDDTEDGISDGEEDDVEDWVSDGEEDDVEDWVYDDKEVDSEDEENNDDELSTPKEDPNNKLISTQKVYTSILITPSKLAIIKAKGILNINVTGVMNDGKKENITQNATYQSSDTKIVTVSKAGRVTTLVKGSATITVTYGKLKKSIMITVK